jgi:hypothetical protein
MLGERELSLPRRMVDVIREIPVMDDLDIELILSQPLSLNPTQLAHIDEQLGDNFLERCYSEMEDRMTPTKRKV